MRLSVLAVLWSFCVGHAGGVSPVSAEVSDPQSDTSYHLEAIDTSGDDLLERFTPSQLAVLEKLNRADLNHLHRLPVLVVPGAWLPNELAYSPMPARYPPAESYATFLVVHLPGQAFAAYEYGKLVRWGPVSSGRRTHATPSGMFHLNWRAMIHTSTVNPEWVMRWSFNFDNRLGIAFHEYAMPGKPASHACVRLLERDARWLFEWGEPWTLDAGGTRVLKPGTLVFVVGEYNFDAPPPWRSLEWLARPVELPSLPVAE